MRVAGPLPALVLTAATATACTSGPTLPEAAAELQQDTRRLETDDVFKNPLKMLRITERPDRDIPCGDGRFKRVLRASANYERVDEPMEDHLDRAQRLMETTLAQQLGYRIERGTRQAEESAGRMIRGAKEELGIAVAVDVRPEAPTWLVRAETACMSR